MEDLPKPNSHKVNPVQIEKEFEDSQKPKRPENI